MITDDRWQMTNAKALALTLAERAQLAFGAVLAGFVADRMLGT
jgi:hypothetical protein